MVAKDVLDDIFKQLSLFRLISNLTYFNLNKRFRQSASEIAKIKLRVKLTLSLGSSLMKLKV